MVLPMEVWLLLAEASPPAAVDMRGCWEVGEMMGGTGWVTDWVARLLLAAAVPAVGNGDFRFDKAPGTRDGLIRINSWGG